MSFLENYKITLFVIWSIRAQIIQIHSFMNDISCKSIYNLFNKFIYFLNVWERVHITEKGWNILKLYYCLPSSETPVFSRHSEDHLWWSKIDAITTISSILRSRFHVNILEPCNDHRSQASWLWWIDVQCWIFCSVSIL